MYNCIHLRLGRGVSGLIIVEPIKANAEFLSFNKRLEGRVMLKEEEDVKLEDVHKEVAVLDDEVKETIFDLLFNSIKLD